MIDIAKARALCAEATPGPWYVSSNGVVHAGGEPDVDGNCDDHEVADMSCNLPKNRIFIAAARTLLPEALDALEEERDSKKRGWALAMEHADTVNALKAEVERLTESIKWHGGALAMFSLGNDQLKAENARLKAVVEAARLCVTPCEHGGAECSCMSNRETYLEACLAALAPATSKTEKT